MREIGLRGLLIYCHCGHHVALSADRWPDEMRLSASNPGACAKLAGYRGADVRPDFERGDLRMAIRDTEPRHEQGLVAALRRADRDCRPGAAADAQWTRASKSRPWLA